MMYSYLVRVLVQTILTTFAVMALVIFLIGFLPDYGTFSGENVPVEHQALEVRSGSVFKNTIDFWKNCFYSDFGRSRIYRNQTAGQIIREYTQVSILLFCWSLSASILVGGFLGFLSGCFSGRWLEKTISRLGLLFTSVPSFLLVPVLVYLFSIRWPLFPPALWEGNKSLVLPLVALSIRPIFFLARILGEELANSAQAEFVITARAKGLREYHIWFFHIIPNSLTAYIVGAGNLFGQQITGSFLVETLFALPGLGFLFVNSLGERDYPVFLGLILIFTLVLQAGHRLSDGILFIMGASRYSLQNRGA